ncbi:hypothetical protein AMR47_06925 [Leptospira interrogans]|nr:hypothetical protein AMR47_06925 [Leptospira interrogans]
MVLNFIGMLLVRDNRVIKKFHNRDSQNCFDFPFQYNGNRWRINFSTTLILFVLNNACIIFL